MYIQVIKNHDNKEKLVRLYIFFRIDNILIMRFRSYNRDTIPRILENLKKKFPDVYKQVKNCKWKFSQKAGCPCGCSPGFIGDVRMKSEIFVTI